MRRILALLLTVAMALSLVVVASATAVTEPGTVDLVITTAETEPESGATELVYYVYLKPQGNAEVGAAQFTLTAPKGASFKDFDINENYVYNDSGTGFGKENGIFALGMMTDGTSGEIGGHIEGSTFKAVLAGTVRETTGSLTKRMLTRANCNEWLYKLTVTLDAPYNENNSYVVGIDKSSLKAGYNRNVNEPTTTTDITLQHTIKTSSIGYGKVAYEIKAVGKNANTPQFTVDGTDLTVTYKLVCIVGYAIEGSNTYTRIDASSGNNQFDLSDVPAGAKVVVVAKGDVNGDGNVNMTDVNRLFRHTTLKEITLVGEQALAGDVVKNGYLNVTDVNRLFRFCVKEIDSL